MLKISFKLYTALAIVFVILTTIFVYMYVKNEAPIYIFDYSGYHETYKNYSKLLQDSPEQFKKEAIESIRNLDYNCTPIILILPFYLRFAGSRFGYIFACCLMYVVPTILLSIFVARKMIFGNKDSEEEEKTIIKIPLFFANIEILGKEKMKTFFTIFICIVSFLYTRWWSPTLRGLPDIVAVIPLMLATIMTLRHNFTSNQKVYVPIAIGFLAYTSFLLRRYFVYAIIGFYVALFVKELIIFIREKENKKSKFIHAFINFAIAGITTLALVLIIQLPLVKNIIAQNYSESYSAYQDTIINHVKRFIYEFGWVIIIFSIIGIIYTIKSKEHRLNGIFCLTSILVCYGSFMTVQAMGVHHYLTISPWIFILFIYGVYGIYNFIKKDVFKIVFLVIVMIMMAINFSTTYIFRLYSVPVISQKNKYCKFRYENFEELERLITDVDALVRDKNVKFSAFASSETLSDNILDFLGTDSMKKSIVYTSAIDLRDGISFNSLMSDYIVVSDIAQTGTSKTGQRVVSISNDAIYNKTGIGKAYERVSGPYTLQGGVKAYIYKKNRSFTEDEVNEYMSELEKYYPDWKTQYTDFDRAVLMGERTLGEGIGDAKRYKYDCIYMLPGFTPSTYKIRTNKKIKSISLHMYIDENGVDTSYHDYGNVKLTIKKDDENIYDDEVRYGKPQNISLDCVDAEYIEFMLDKNGELSWDNLYMEIKNIEYVGD